MDISAPCVSIASTTLSQFAESSLSPQVLAVNLPPHCRLIAAQRAAGDAFGGTLNEQLSPSADGPILPAAKAALEALTQTSRTTAARISMTSFMARVSLIIP